MPKIPVTLRLGEKLPEEVEKVESALSEAYEDISINLNKKPDMIIRDDQAPTSSDFNHDLASFWLNRDLTGGSPELYFMTVKNQASATWVQII